MQSPRNVFFLSSVFTILPNLVAEQEARQLIVQCEVQILVLSITLRIKIFFLSSAFRMLPNLVAEQEARQLIVQCGV